MVTSGVRPSILQRLEASYSRLVGGTERFFVGDMANATLAEAEHRQATLIGPALFVTLENLPEPPTGYMQITPILSFGDGRKVRRYVQQDVAQALGDAPVTCAVESYIAWGRKNKHDVQLLITGANTGGGIHLDLYVFTRGALTTIVERQLPAATSALFGESLRAVIREFETRFPITRKVVADPTPPIFDHTYVGLEYVGAAPFRRTLYFPMRAYLARGVKLVAAARRKQQSMGRRAWVAPVAMVSMAVAISTALLLHGVTKYERAKSRFVEVASVQQSQHVGGIDADLLSRMETHRKILSGATAHREQATLLLSLARATASIPEVHVKSVSIPLAAPGPSPAVAVAGEKEPVLASIEVMMKPDDATDPVVQGKKIARELSHRSGMTTVISPGGVLSVDFKTQMRVWRIDVTGRTGTISPNIAGGA